MQGTQNPIVQSVKIQQRDVKRTSVKQMNIESSDCQMAFIMGVERTLHIQTGILQTEDMDVWRRMSLLAAGWRTAFAMDCGRLQCRNLANVDLYSPPC